ncbi:MAG: hypothetical protein KDC44_03040 [Phaeodactylibacter sp.]|nr:hypothetical protein [Phaeodactylibacter sp.]
MGLVATHILTQLHQDTESHRSDRDQAPIESGVEIAPEPATEYSLQPPRLQPFGLYQLARRIRAFWSAFWTDDQLKP